MSYALADANGYLGDFASIGGMASFAAWAKGVGGPVAAFVDAGTADDPLALADALDHAKASGTNDEMRRALSDAARAADTILILSDGTGDEEDVDVDLSTLTYRERLAYLLDFDENQPRGDNGQWVAGGGGSSGSSGSSSSGGGSARPSRPVTSRMSRRSPPSRPRG